MPESDYVKLCRYTLMKHETSTEGSKRTYLEQGLTKDEMIQRMRAWIKGSAESEQGLTKEMTERMREWLKRPAGSANEVVTIALQTGDPDSYKIDETTYFQIPKKTEQRRCPSGVCHSISQVVQGPGTIIGG